MRAHAHVATVPCLSTRVSMHEQGAVSIYALGDAGVSGWLTVCGVLSRDAPEADVLAAQHIAMVESSMQRCKALPLKLLDAVDQRRCDTA